MRRFGAMRISNGPAGTLPGLLLAALLGTAAAVAQTGPVPAGTADSGSVPRSLGWSPAEGGPPFPGREFILESPLVIRAPRRGGNFLKDYLRRNTVVLEDESLPSAPGFPRMGRYELSRSEVAFRGLGTGATLGLWAGALGSSFGWWGDDEALLMMGAMSAAGAAWAGTRDGARYGLRWRPPAE